MQLRYLFILLAAPVSQLSSQVGSASASVIRSTAPRLAENASWHLTPNPSLNIGGGEPDGPEDYSSSSRVLELPNGLIVFYSGATGQVRFYNASGAMIAKVGRRGEGPGEFRTADLFPGRGDTIMVYDGIVRRLTVIDGSGRIVRMGPFRAPRQPSIGYAQGMLSKPLATLANGALVLTSWPALSVGPPSSHYRDSLLVLAMKPGDSIATPVVRTGHFETYQHPNRSQGTWLRFQKHTVVAAGTDRIYVARNDQWEVEVYSFTGRLLQRLLRPIQPTAVTPAFIRSLPAPERPAQWDQWSDQRRTAWQNDLRDRMYAKHFPPISDMFVSPDGLLYVLESDDPRAPKTLAVFDLDGTFLTQFRVPDGLRVVAVGRSRVYGRMEDEDGIRYLLGYDISGR